MRHKIINALIVDPAAERRHLVSGLLSTPATIAPKYFYDEQGCALYGAICLLDEYYPTRTERAIFQQYRGEIATSIGKGGTFVDLGAGDCGKALAWLPHILPNRYLAVDIASPSLNVALASMSPKFPDVEMAGLVTDFSQTLSIPADLLCGKVTLFYPGSSIGNFAPEDATRFLRQMQTITQPSGGGLLIGVDAKKNKAKLDAAYDDVLGVTAAFNLNALRHINHVLGCNFNIAAWQHVGFYNEAMGRIEMHLESKVGQMLLIEEQSRHFAKGEKIHSENSYKYHRHEFEALLLAAGFGEVTCWTNEAKEFWVFYAK
ncbi:MAG: L-histidine N(alpha)-methyltransferase [Pseudomonadota bacterium]